MIDYYLLVDLISIVFFYTNWTYYTLTIKLLFHRLSALTLLFKFSKSKQSKKTFSLQITHIAFSKYVMLLKWHWNLFLLYRLLCILLYLKANEVFYVIILYKIDVSYLQLLFNYYFHYKSHMSHFQNMLHYWNYIQIYFSYTDYYACYYILSQMIWLFSTKLSYLIYNVFLKFKKISLKVKIKYKK